GHRVIGLAYGEAVSGGFLAGGMMADVTVALPEAQVQVMDLAAMARVMRVPPERLRELAASSPVFAPGAESFLKLAGIAEIWTGDLSAHLQRVLKVPPQPTDDRAEMALARGGRMQAASVIARVRQHG
ncbi:MAG TPA: biotin-independent malonate decarboxylase subunit gamma, partial [Albitalea sp.]|nr:biotin-independent malonate decarboxylase subunit gamma [Albitalea sp.]